MSRAKDTSIKVDRPLTTKGDVYVYGTSADRLPVGTNNQVLTADSTQALGVKWADAAGGGSTLLGVDAFYMENYNTDKLLFPSEQGGYNMPYEKGSTVTSPKVEFSDVGWDNATDYSLGTDYYSPQLWKLSKSFSSVKIKGAFRIYYATSLTGSLHCIFFKIVATNTVRYLAHQEFINPTGNLMYEIDFSYSGSLVEDDRVGILWWNEGLGLVGGTGFNVRVIGS